tara:strand:+ start:590158 stop:590766 length:609 start_codon:yes stop_codon:yes gene_type:complete
MLPLIFVAISFVGAGADEPMVSLYNGNDLRGWTTTGNWIPQDDGSLMLRPREGEEGWKRYDAYLWADQPYGDFVFDFEYKHESEGNSGFYFHVKDKDDPVETGIEIQIKDSYGDTGKLGPHHCGGVVRTQAPAKNMSRPPGQWNHMVVRCESGHLQVELNGEAIIDMQLDKSAVSDRPDQGWLGIQDHGQKFWVRNVQAKRL